MQIPSSSPGSLLVERYRILEKIGEGGFGVVYKARDENRPNKLVAIKQINLAALSVQEKIEATDSYNREIMLLSKLRHESLPHIYDHFTDQEHWYVIMDYIEGETLEETIKRVRRRYLPLNSVLDIGIALCDVLGYLHEQQPPIIFRDVKPSNIMVSHQGRLYLIDFGIARRYRAGQAKDTGQLGSPGYAAPEQYGRAQTTIQTDIYGLGATLQTLLTGKEPLEILVGGLPDGHAIPRSLQALIARMMERDASQRPHNMREVKQCLLDLKVEPFWKQAKHGSAFAWHLLKSLSPLAAILCLIFLLLAVSVNGFFSSWFGILYLLLVLCIFIGRSLYSLLQEMQGASIRLNMKEVLAIVSKQTAGSTMMALGLAFIFYILYDILSGQGADMYNPVAPFLLGIVVIVGVVFGLYCLIRGVLRVIKWLKRTVASQRQSHTQAQTPPLQQQMRRHP